MEKKIRIAFIKLGGLSAGGTEKFLQTIAANLNRDLFIVDFFYCDSPVYINSDFTNTNQDRKNYMDRHNVHLIKFNIESINMRNRTHDWIHTDFWKKFNEDDYDIIQTGRAGPPEYPFTKIKKTPIVDSLHLLAGVDNQYNISRVMHITNWSAKKWIRMGGDRKRVEIVSHPMEINAHIGNLRKKIDIDNTIFIFGFHQRASNDIFSDIPLQAYKKIENEKTMFLIMGGSKRYSDQANKLEIKNFKQLPHSAKPQDIYDFLQTLNVYAHGRKDGEVNSTAMAEAMFFGLPIISHTSKINNGHIECIAEAGKVVKNINDYEEEMIKIIQDKEYYAYRSKRSKDRFQEKYELSEQMKIIENIYTDVIKNPFNYPLWRKISSFRLYYTFIFFFPRIFNLLKRKLGLYN